MDRRRWLDGAAGELAAPAALFVGGGPIPEALRGRRATASALVRPEDLVLSPSGRARPVVAGSPGVRVWRRLSSGTHSMPTRRRPAWPRLPERKTNVRDTRRMGLPRGCGSYSRLIKDDVGARVFYVSQQGYDTHAGQLGNHALLLREWAESLKGFLDDLADARLGERVVVLSFSEFGRTVRRTAQEGPTTARRALPFWPDRPWQRAWSGRPPNCSSWMRSTGT